MSSSHLRAGDVDAMLRIVEDGRRDDPAEAMPWAVLEGLERLVSSEADTSFGHADLHERRGSFQSIEGGTRVTGEDGDDGTNPRDNPFWSLFWGSYCSYPQRSGDLVSVLQDGDFFRTDQNRRNDPVWYEIDRPCGFIHSMMMSLPAPAGQIRRIHFRRGYDTGFSERDRQVITLLRPHPYEIWVSAERRRNNVPRLTEREWEVLRLSAAGLGNADIARQLFISRGTVRKHIAHSEPARRAQPQPGGDHRPATRPTAARARRPPYRRRPLIALSSRGKHRSARY